MIEDFFARPILNSPYEYPARHWELDKSGQPTNKIADQRRRAEFITPIPKHDRESAFEQACLEHAISAVAACVILLAAQFGPHSLERFDLKSLFRFESVPQWPVNEWYIDPVAGESWTRDRFPFP